MYDFYVKGSKKLIDYKPKRINYFRALQKLLRKIQNYDNPCDTFPEMKKEHKEDFNKLIFLFIKYCGFKDCKNLNVEEIEIEFTGISLLDDMIGQLTPREFMQLFPIAKEYNGEKYGCKDYFYCINFINEFGIDNKIGDKAPIFLFEYWNWDINNYMVYWMEVVSCMNIMQGGKDPLIEFMEEQGVTSHLVVDGEYIIDTDTGEKFKLSKPKSNVKKLFSV